MQIDDIIEAVKNIFSVFISIPIFIGILWFSKEGTFFAYKGITMINNHSVISGYLHEEYQRKGKKRLPKKFWGYILTYDYVVNGKTYTEETNKLHSNHKIVKDFLRGTSSIPIYVHNNYPDYASEKVPKFRLIFLLPILPIYLIGYIIFALITLLIRRIKQNSHI